MRCTGLLLAALLALAGCGADRQEWATAADRDATAADIFDHGHPESVAVSGDRTLVVWQVSPEDDEGPTQSAWRLYGKDNKRIAEGQSAQANAEAFGGLRGVAVPGGFAVSGAVPKGWAFLDHRGRLTAIKRGASTDLKNAVLLETPMTTPSGEIDGRYSAFDPDSRRLVLLPKMPSDAVQSVQVDDDGRVWIELPNVPVRVAYADGGRKPWTVEKVPAPKDSFGGGGALMASYGRLILPVTHMVGGDTVKQNTVVDAVMVREHGIWRRVPADGVDKLDETVPVFTFLPDGRLFGTTFHGPAWVMGDDGRFERIKAPGKATDDATVSPNIVHAGSKFWAIDSVGWTLWSSDDGRDWEEFQP